MRRRAWLVVAVLAAGLVRAADIRLPSEAFAVLRDLLRGTRESAKPVPAGKPAPAEGTPTFVSDVRLVNLSVSVSDRSGRPVRALRPDDFEVLEDGAPQKIAVAGAEEVPFNLVLLLDLSGSTIRSRAAMKEAARRFVGITRPQDRIALHLIADGLFSALSPLTEERAKLIELLDGIPDLRGNSPIYAAILLGYAEEFAARPQERNAMIVISDGMDDNLVRQASEDPSLLRFDLVRKAVAAMPLVIYPIYLDSRNIFFGARARKQMEQVATESGGRLFAARSIEDLEPVYAQVARELRSVYTLAYYPRNQKFDGRWRRIQVRARRQDVRVRSRDGYYAR
ncbi:MAG: VWA domain-containing protein [Bryobacteraceae bacterium]